MYAHGIRHEDNLGPRIILGGLQMGQDPLPPALVAISYPSYERAYAAAKLLMSIQNGVVPFQSRPNVCAGDNAIEVNVSPIPVPDKGHLVQVMAKAHPEHLTYCYYVVSYVSEDQLSAFDTFFRSANHYVLTVAHGDTLLLDIINMIKYTVNRRGV